MSAPSLYHPLSVTAFLLVWCLQGPFWSRFWAHSWKTPARLRYCCRVQYVNAADAGISSNDPYETYVDWVGARFNGYFNGDGGGAGGGSGEGSSAGNDGMGAAAPALGKASTTIAIEARI